MNSKTVHFLLVWHVTLYSTPIQTMQVPPLQKICIRSLSNSHRDIDLTDLPGEEKKLRKSLETLPEKLQQAVITEIDSHLQPEWHQEKYINLELCNHNFQYIHNWVVWCTKEGTFIRDLSIPTCVTIPLDATEPIKHVCKAPNAPLIATASKNKLYIYCLQPIITLLHKTPIAHTSALAFSWENNPTLFVGKSTGIVVKFSNITSRSFEETMYKLPLGDEHIITLAVAPNEQYFIAGCQKNPSYKVTMLNNSEYIPETIDTQLNRVLISQNSAFAVGYNWEKEKTCIITDQSILSRPGSFVGIKNNLIITKKNGSLSFFNYKGELCHRFTILPSLVKIPIYCSSYGLPCFLCKKKFKEPYQLLIPNNNTIKNTKNLIYKIAVEKAKKTKNLGMLSLLRDNTEFEISDALKANINEYLKTAKSRKKKIKTILTTNKEHDTTVRKCKKSTLLLPDTIIDLINSHDKADNRNFCLIS